MDPQRAASQTGPPSAPPSDSFYPMLYMETKDYPQDLPPAYEFAAGPNVNPGGTPQGPPQVPQQSIPNSNVASAGANTQQNATPSVVATVNHPQPVQLVVQGDPGASVPPGVCHLCKKGKIKDSATCCSWVSCFLLLPFGIIPGLIAFCYACRKPKCNRCGFVHGKKK